MKNTSQYVLFVADNIIMLSRKKPTWYDLECLDCIYKSPVFSMEDADDEFALYEHAYELHKEEIHKKLFNPGRFYLHKVG